MDFVRTQTALFRLILASKRPDHSGPDLTAASGRAQGIIAQVMSKVTGLLPDDPRTIREAAAVGSMAHGLADLISAGRLGSIRALPVADEDRVVSELLVRSLSSEAARAPLDE